MGDDNTFVNVEPPDDPGDRNTYVGPNQPDGSVRYDQGSVAIGAGAQAGPNSVAIGAGAGAAGGVDVLQLLVQLREALRSNDVAAEAVANLTAEVQKPSSDPSRIRQLWAVIKVAATANEAALLVATLSPLIERGLGHL